jgi:hypothetical protein
MFVDGALSSSCMVPRSLGGDDGAAILSMMIRHAIGEANL